MGLWKYATTQHQNEFLLSLELLGRTPWTKEKQLACLYAVSNHTEKHYETKHIPKRSGGYRTIYMPDPLLKNLQRNILKNVLHHLPVSPFATAYQKGSSVRTNAQPHVAKKQVLKLDIEDFFTSITFPMIYIAAFPGIYFPPAVATILTALCTYRDYLPQGAPTSAAISNLVMLPFDTHMSEWCQARNITYTRYCDDMTFSGEFSPGKVITKTRNFLEVVGFTLHEDKISLQTESTRQIVTGVVVNEKLQAPRPKRRELRQQLYYCKQFGVESHLKSQGLGTALEEQISFLESLLGKIAFVLELNSEDKEFKEAKDQVCHWLREAKSRRTARE